MAIAQRNSRAAEQYFGTADLQRAHHWPTPFQTKPELFVARHLQKIWCCLRCEPGFDLSLLAVTDYTSIYPKAPQLHRLRHRFRGRLSARSLIGFAMGVPCGIEAGSVV